MKLEDRLQKYINNLEADIKGLKRKTKIELINSLNEKDARLLQDIRDDLIGVLEGE